ncbi:hypothetical protein GCM10027346_22910 [Hymenobacter seoulensis]
MKESERITDQLQRAFWGEAWSGPSLQQVLAGISAAQAAAHPLPGIHSIGELVRHLTTWADTVTHRIERLELTPPTADDWPAFESEPSETAWQQARQELQQAHERLLAAASTVAEGALDTVLREVPARPDGAADSVYVLLHGTAQHYLYHAGQIALLRKLV